MDLTSFCYGFLAGAAVGLLLDKWIITKAEARKALFKDPDHKK